MTCVQLWITVGSSNTSLLATSYSSYKCCEVLSPFLGILEADFSIRIMFEIVVIVDKVVKFGIFSWVA